MFLEVQLLTNYVDVTEYSRYLPKKTAKIVKINHSLYLLLMARSGRSLRYCYLEFDMEAISDDWSCEMAGIRGFEF